MKQEKVTSTKKWEGKGIDNKQGHKTKARQPLVTSPQKLRVQQKSRLTATSPQKWEYRGKAKQIHRTIPSYLRRHIWERDEGQCTYMHPQTKRKCSSKIYCR